MSFDYLKHFFGQANVLMFEIAAFITGALTLFRWIRREIDEMKGPKKNDHYGPSLSNLDAKKPPNSGL